MVATLAVAASTETVDRVGQVAADQLVDRPVQGGREQQPLAVVGHGVEESG